MPEKKYKLCYPQLGNYDIPIQYFVNNGLHQGFTDTVSDLHGFDVDKITFHGMQKNIYTATFGLIFRQSIGESRVHQSEFRATEVTAGASTF